MGRKGKGKKGQKIVTDLDTFNNQEIKKQQEKDFQQVQSSKNEGPSGQIDQKKGIIESNPNEDIVSKFNLAQGNNSSEEFQLQSQFYLLDNKMIDAYYQKKSNFKEEEKELLEEEEFLHFSRQVVKDLDFLLNLPFVRFWGYITKLPEIMEFLDEFLLNVRKYNDIYKAQFIDFSKQLVKDSDRIGWVTEEIKRNMNKILDLVLRVFYRLSKSQESDQHYFSDKFYQALIYDNWIFDMPKLVDLAAVYYQSNNETLKQVILNVFEGHLRYVQDFKEGYDVVLNLFKKVFKETIKVDSMLKGERVYQKTKEEQEEVIVRVLEEYVEVLNSNQLIINSFPDQILEIIRNTNAMLYLANSYCAMKTVGRHWGKDSLSEPLIHDLKKTIMKSSVSSCLYLLESSLLKQIGTHQKNFALVQHQIAQNLKQFILSLTGNQELSKDSLQKHVNFMAEKGAGTLFLKKLLKKVPIRSYVESIEDRFLPDGDKPLLGQILQSLEMGQSIQVRKIKYQPKVNEDKGIIGQIQAQQQQKKQIFSLQDKENISNLVEMFNGEHSRPFVENIYVANGKDFEKTLEQFLSGNLPKDSEIKIIKQESPKKVEEEKEEQIDTTTKEDTNFKLDEFEFRNYIMQEYGDYLGSRTRQNRNQKYQQEHIRALEIQKEEEEADRRELKERLLAQGDYYQYEDDFDDNLPENMNRKRREEQDSDSSDDGEEEQKKKPSLQGRKILQKSNEKQGSANKVKKEDADDDDENDDQVDFVEKYIENEEDLQNRNNEYMFQEVDYKHVKRMEEEKKKKEREDNDNKQTGKKDDKQFQKKQGGRGDQRDNRDNREYRDNRDNRDNREYRDNRDNRDNRGQRENQEQREDKNRQQQQYQRGEQRQNRDQQDSYRQKEQPKYQPKYVVKGTTQEESNQEKTVQNVQQEEEEDSKPQVFRGGRGNRRGGYGQRGQRGRGGRGRGYSDNYQRDDKEQDDFYTSENPMRGENLENQYDEDQDQKNSHYQRHGYREEGHSYREAGPHDSDEENEEEGGSQRGGRGGFRGRGRGRGNSRGGYHNQKNLRDKKMRGGFGNFQQN